MRINFLYKGDALFSVQETAMSYPDIVHTQAYKQAFNLYLRKGVPIKSVLKAGGIARTSNHPLHLAHTGRQQSARRACGE
jgi:hypothetical protein